MLTRIPRDRIKVSLSSRVADPGEVDPDLDPSFKKKIEPGPGCKEKREQDTTLAFKKIGYESDKTE